MTEIILTEKSRRDHAGGRKRTSATKSRAMKNIYRIGRLSAIWPETEKKHKMNNQHN